MGPTSAKRGQLGPTWSEDGLILGPTWADFGPNLGPSWLDFRTTLHSSTKQPEKWVTRRTNPRREEARKRATKTSSRAAGAFFGTCQGSKDRCTQSMQRALLAMHFGTVFQAKRRPKTVPKPPSTPASIQERVREPPDFDLQAMLGPFWPHVGPMLGPRAPKSSPRGAQAWSLDGPGAAQERPRAPKRPQGAPRRPPEADFGPKMRPIWAHVGSVFQATSGKLTYDKRRRDKRSTNKRSRDNHKQEKGSRHKRRQDHESQDKGKASHEETLEMMPAMCHANRHGSTN